MPAPAHALMMIGAGGSIPSLSQAILANSPVGYWKLNDSNNQATDYSGNARHGTYTGTGYTLQGATGGDGNLYVDMGNGASSHISVADNDAWSANTSSGLTVFALCKPDSVGGATPRNIISKGQNPSDYEWALVESDGSTAKLRFFTWNAGGVTCRSVTSNSAVMTTSWQAVCAVTESPTTTCTQWLYYNSGSAISSTLATSSGTPYANLAAQIRIGYRADNPANQYWQGGLAHIAIFAGQLNATQVGSMMTAADNEGWF